MLPNAIAPRWSSRGEWHAEKRKLPVRNSDCRPQIEEANLIGIGRPTIVPGRPRLPDRKGRHMCLGVPGKVTAIWEAAGTRMSTVDFGGSTKTVCLAYLPDMEVGEYTIVHAGYAISRLDEESALETRKMFDDLGLFEDEDGRASSA